MLKNAQTTIAHVTEKLAGKAQVGKSATPTNSGFHMVGNKMVIATYDEFSITTHQLKKDGTRTGKMKAVTMPFVHSYCPHCGEKYPTE